MKIKSEAINLAELFKESLGGVITTKKGETWLQFDDGSWFCLDNFKTYEDIKD